MTRLPLLWWVALFVAHRALVVLLGFDGVYFWEETYRLTIAEALRSGWDIPLHDLQADPYAGGSLVFGALAAVATTLFGSSLVVLKAVAITWNAAGLWLWLVATDRIGGRRAAHILGLVWLAAPPVFVVFNVVGQGFHGDTITLAGLQWLLLLRYADEPARRGRLVAWMAAAGVSIWFSYASAIPFVAGAVWALAAGLLPVRAWPLAAAGFVAGFSPWIARTIVAGGSLDIVGQTFATWTGGPTRMFDLAARGVPAALYFRNIGIPGDVRVHREWFSYSYLAVYAACWLAVVLPVVRRIADAGAARMSTVHERIRQHPELAILGVFPLFVVAIAASNQEFNDYGMVRWFTFRILVPALPSAFFAIALATSRAPAALRAGALVVCIACGLVGTGEIVTDGHALRELRETEARETGAEAFGHLLVFKHGTDPVFGPRIAALPAELRERAYRGIGFSFAYLFGTRRSDAPASALTKALLSVDATWRKAAIDGARSALAEGLPQVAPLPPSARRDELAAAIDRAGAEPYAAPESGDRAGVTTAPRAPVKVCSLRAPRRDRTSKQPA